MRPETTTRLQGDNHVHAHAGRLERAADHPRPVLHARRESDPWEATEWALRRIQKFQLCTVRRDGRPHVTPLLAIWAHGAMWFTTGDSEQKAKNLDANQRCALTTGTDTLTGTDYVIEGTARLVTDEATGEAVATAFEEAYGWQLTREDGTWYRLGDAIRSRNVQLYRVQPETAFAFTTGSESSQTRYRWRQLGAMPPA